ncbi:MAG: hypothetical protein HZC41_03460 [Chloroflexi bacterium]|nr:hypothetical protein [Chloroflexota bacterium]
MSLVIPIRARTVALILGLIAVYLAAQSIAGRYLEDAVRADASSLFLNFVRTVNVNREASIPAWYSSALLLGAAGLMALTAAVKRACREPFIRHWFGLAVIFVYLSLDEAAALHENLTEPLQTALDTSGYLTFAWVIVGAIFVGVVGLVYLRFLLALPRRTRTGMIAAGALYVGGALVIEAISANQWYQDDGTSLLYSAIGTVEELCEMLGVVVLIYTLLDHWQQMLVNVQLQPVPPASDAPRSGLLAVVKPSPRRWQPSRPLVIVFFGGANLMLVQWVLAREMTALLLGTELVILLVSVAYFAGLSLGYFLAGRLPRSWLLPIGAVTLALHLALPVWFRLLVAGLDAVGEYAAAYILLPLLTVLVVPAFYSVFLPLFADAGEGKLPTLYAVELAGSACGVLALFLLGGVSLPAILLAYAIGLVAILLALRLRPLYAALLAGAAALWLAVLPAANAWSNARWYEQLQGLPAGTQTLYTAYSPYQKVDVLQDPDGSRYLYLDGLNHYGTYSGQRLNVVMGLIPGMLARPNNALVAGAGSMQMEAMIADFAGHVTTVEIDPLVVEASRRYFADANRMDTLTNRSIVIDDAKHFFANTDDRYDLVAMDIPAAYSIQTATLYAEPFVSAVKARLNFGGVLVANLTSDFEPGDLVSRRIVATLLPYFDDVMVVTAESAGWSFAYASDDLPFTRQDVENALRQTGETSFVIFETPAVRAIAGEAAPVTLDTMDIVLHVSLDWLRSRWGE